MEILPLHVSSDRAMALAAPSADGGKGSANQVDISIVDAPIGGVSHNNPLVQSSEYEAGKEALINGKNVSTKRQITWMESPLAKDIGINTIRKRLSKMRNID